MLIDVLQHSPISRYLQYDNSSNTYSAMCSAQSHDPLMRFLFTQHKRNGVLPVTQRPLRGKATFELVPTRQSLRGKTSKKLRLLSQMHLDDLAACLVMVEELYHAALHYTAAELQFASKGLNQNALLYKMLNMQQEDVIELYENVIGLTEVSGILLETTEAASYPKALMLRA